MVIGRTDRDLCPVVALLGYIESRGDQPGPFFLTSASLPLLKQQFISQFQAILETLGLPAEDYTGHSFRIGAAPAAALGADSLTPSYALRMLEL